MEQIVSITNALIAFIVNYTAFFIIYGAILYYIGAVIYQILCPVIKQFFHIWKRCYNEIRRRKQ